MEEQVDRYDEPRTQGGSQLGPLDEHVEEGHEGTEPDSESDSESEGEHAADVAPSAQGVAP
jgi:hypothetical protein